LYQRQLLLWLLPVVALLGAMLTTPAMAMGEKAVVGEAVEKTIPTQEALERAEHTAINLKTSKLVEVTPLIINDKTGVSYAFRDDYELRHGKAWFSYSIAPTDNPTNAQIVYKGETFGEGETCPNKQRKEYVRLHQATTDRKYAFTDINGDGWKDIAFYVTEMDCTIHHITHKTILFTATDNGFQHELTLTEEK